ncbi:hypothetical protein V6L78_11640 [Pseudomonas canadensis]|uniref:hypothetical protein n=1 Tax=Pseudomonas canadensis TaxID=915099 RepID=UPI0030D18340
MSVIAAYNPAVRLPTVPDTKPAAEAKEKAPTPANASDTKAVEGVTVTISSAAFQASKANSNPNQDIDDSNLKDNIKQLLKMIRELKKQIADKMAEISAAMADTSMTPEQRQAKVGNLQASLSALQGGLATAQAQLGKAMKGESPEAQMEAMSLAAK